MPKISLKSAYQYLSEEEKARVWSKTYHTLITSGFTEGEADWTANKGFTLKENIMKRLITRRKEDIKMYRRLWGYSRAEAIAELGRNVNVRNQAKGASEEDLYDIMRILYP